MTKLEHSQSKNVKWNFLEGFKRYYKEFEAMGRLAPVLSRVKHNISGRKNDCKDIANTSFMNFAGLTLWMILNVMYW